MMQHHKLAFTAALVLAITLTFSCSSGGDDNSSGGTTGGSPGGGSSGGGGTLTDSDGNTYKTKQIGTQVWMAENLNYNASGSKCGDESTGTLSDGNTATCDKYGRLYDWATAMALDASCNSSTCASQVSAKHRGICPSGWHIPSDADWAALMTAVGGSSTAGTKLKAREGWEPSSGVPAGTDDYGFSALPGGLGGSDGYFGGVGYYGLWWSASEYNSSNAYYGYMDYNYEIAGYDDSYKDNLFSVRCLQD